ncbi:MAG: hypothetical protein AB7W47_04355 [Calditrichaceae bacterium]
MKRTILYFLLFLTIGFMTVHADDNTTDFKITPPPVSCIKFFPGVKQFSVTGIYYKMGELEGQTGSSDSPVAYGFNANYAFSSPSTLFGAQNGGIITFSYMRITMPAGASEIYDEDINTNSFNLGYTAVLDLINGEKRDIAGEIIALKPTWAVFFGSSINYFSLNMGPLYQAFGHSQDIKAINLITSLSLGSAADFPIGSHIALVPFIRYTMNIAQTIMDVPEPFNPDKLYSETYTSDYSYLDYGMDIDVRPFSNSPDWIISLGTAMAQVEGMKNGNLLITLGIKHEIGKYYSSTTVGPALH